MKKRKIICPNDDAHAVRKYEKILIAYEESDKPPTKFWIHCDDMKCKRWFQVEFNSKGGATAKQMPKGYHFDFHKTPILTGS